MTTLGLVLNTVIMAPTQYAHLDFNSLCVFNGEVLGSNEDGIFSLEGDTDDGAEIEAFFQIPSTDLGIPAQKKVRSLVLSGYNCGNLIITVISDNDEETEYPLSQSGIMDNISTKVDLNSDDIGRFVGLLVENVDGSDFSIDVIDLLVLTTVLDPKTRNVLVRSKVNFPLFSSTSTATVVEV